MLGKSYSRGWEENLRTKKTGSNTALKSGSSGSSKSYSPQVVFKVISHSKTAKGAGSIAEYISENAEDIDEQEKGMYNEYGQFIPVDELKEEFRSWGIEEGERLSQKAKNADPHQLRNMPDSEKYTNKLVSHYMISFPHRQNEISDDQMRNITEDTLAPFSDKGHHYLYAIHRHQNKPHVHIVIKYRDEENKRLDLLPRDLQNVREHIASVSKEHGVELSASRRFENIRERVAVIPTVELYELHEEKKTLQASIKDQVRAGETSELIEKRIQKVEDRKEKLQAFMRAEKKLPKVRNKIEGKGLSFPFGKKQSLSSLHDEENHYSQIIKEELNLRKARLSLEFPSPEGSADLRELNDVKKELEAKYRSSEEVQEQLRMVQELTQEIKDLDPALSDLAPQKRDYQRDIIPVNDMGVSPDILRGKVESWYEKFGLDYELRRNKGLDYKDAARIEQVKFPALPKKTNEALKEWASNFKNPDLAKNSFLAMASDNKKTAFWYAQKNIKVFGEVKDSSINITPINSKTVWIKNEWAQEAQNRLIISNEKQPDMFKMNKIKMATSIREKTILDKKFDENLDIFSKNPREYVEAHNNMPEERISGRINSIPDLSNQKPRTKEHDLTRAIVREKERTRAMPTDLSQNIQKTRSNEKTLELERKIQKGPDEE